LQEVLNSKSELFQVRKAKGAGRSECTAKTVISSELGLKALVTKALHF
jgi:hypothetical protein